MAFRPALVLFAAFYLNLFLCFGIGIRELAAKKTRPVFQTVYVWTIIALVTFSLWVFFERVLAFVPWVPAYLLLYPCSLFACLGLEILLFELFPSLGENPQIFRIGSPYSAFSLASLYLTIQFAPDFIDALLLALAFSAGAAAAYFAVREIRRRSFLETTPGSLRGNPLIIISAGLLSLIVTAAALFAIRALEG
jgi:Na+-translocating ferredoxin:NAD+ oxidoreductase RnfA subunit